MPDLDKLRADAARISAAIDALDRDIRATREKKAALAAQRAAVLAELELQTKLRTLTPEHRRRITVTAVAAGTGRAVK